MHLRFHSILLVVLCCSCGDEESHQIPVKATANQTAITTPRFEKILPLKSGIDFENTITHDLSSKVNLFDYDFFYNGSGVGVADLNNDGLKDLFFCGNQVENRLYINKGNLEFEDMTTNAQLGTSKWSSGVTFADINQDGFVNLLDVDPFVSLLAG